MSGESNFTGVCALENSVTPLSTSVPLNESGYFSMNSTEESEEMEVAIAVKNNIAKHFSPELMILGEDGGFVNQGRYWGAGIRSFQRLDNDNQFHPLEPPVFHHLIFNVNRGSRMDQLHARPGFFFKEIKGAPTSYMDAETFAKNLAECEDRMEDTGSVAYFKFLEVQDEDDDIYYNVEFKSAGKGKLIDIDVRKSEGQSASVETDDDRGDIVEGLELCLSDHVVLKRPAYTGDGQSYYIFCDNGDSVYVRDYLKLDDNGYVFKMCLYYGIYKGKSQNSLTSGDSVYPLVIKLPFCQKKVIAAQSSTVDVADYSLDETVIREPDPGLFFLKRVDGGSFVLQSTTESERCTALFLGVDEDGTLKPIQPDEHYKSDPRLHFRKLKVNKQGDSKYVFEMVCETSV